MLSTHALTVRLTWKISVDSTLTPNRKGIGEEQSLLLQVPRRRDSREENCWIPEAK
jgi:hypothetical protein